MRRNKSVKRHLHCEALERRELLAGDLIPAAGLSPELKAEGEAAPVTDLVAFAEDLAEADAVLYCADWAESCAEQLALFEDGADSLPYVEVGTPDRFGNSIASVLGLTTVPTWILSDGERIEQVASLEELADAVGIDIPTGVAPYLAQVQDVVVPTQSPVHVPLDAYDPNGDSLTFTFEVADTSVVTGEILQGNRSLRMTLDDYGEMVFELFEQRAPRPSGRVIELAQSGFYDGVGFHRIFNDFVIQGGDPTGTGAGGSELGGFDDQFHLDLQHNTTGLLSYAKAGDDTGDSQFFITEGPQRHLDFNHAIFGTLVEGERVREAISRTATNASRPLFPVLMSQVEVFADTENRVLLLHPQSVGTTSLTVTATDVDGNAVSQTFDVSVEQDDINTPPFLNDIPKQRLAGGSDSSFAVSAVDREGDELTYSVAVLSSDPAEPELSATVDASGQITVHQPEDFLGEIRLEVTVGQAAGTPTGGGDRFDRQVVVVDVVPGHQNQAAPLDVNGDGVVVPIDALIVINHLNASSDTGRTTGFADPGLNRDVNGDLFITAIDVLLIVNHLNSQAEGEAGSEAEGEAEALAERDAAFASFDQSSLESIFSLGERDRRFRFGD